MRLLCLQMSERLCGAITFARGMNGGHAAQKKNMHQICNNK